MERLGQSIGKWRLNASQRKGNMKDEEGNKIKLKVLIGLMVVQ